MLGLRTIFNKHNYQSSCVNEPICIFRFSSRTWPKSTAFLPGPNFNSLTKAVYEKSFFTNK